MMNTPDMRAPTDFMTRLVRAAADERRALETLERIRAGEAFVMAEHLLVADTASHEEKAFLELRWTGGKWSAKPRELSFELITACALEGVLQFPFDDDHRGTCLSATSDVKHRGAGPQRHPASRRAQQSTPDRARAQSQRGGSNRAPGPNNARQPK